MITLLSRVQRSNSLKVVYHKFCLYLLTLTHDRAMIDSMSNPLTIAASKIINAHSDALQGKSVSRKQMSRLRKHAQNIDQRAHYIHAANLWQLSAHSVLSEDDKLSHLINLLKSEIQ